MLGSREKSAASAVMRPLNVGLIGCGRISDISIKNIQRFAGLELMACASLDSEESRVADSIRVDL